MKKLIILFATILFVGCQQPTDSIASVKMDDDKTQAIKQMFENYMAYGTDAYDADYDQSIISDDLTGNNSIPGLEINKDSFVATDAEHHALFENINMWLPGTDDGTGGGLHTTITMSLVHGLIIGEHGQELESSLEMKLLNLFT